jgi:hypothetical protein
MAYKRVNNELKLEGVRLIWRNFAGEKKLYNENGKRQFAIPLEEPLALELRDIGWNVRDNSRKVQEDPSKELLYHLDVTVKLDGRVPPRIFMVAKKWSEEQQKEISIRTQLDEDTIMLLDYAELETVDLILRPFNWDVNGKQGVSAYLKTLFAFLRQDDLEAKYAHIPIEGPEQLAIEAGDDILDVEGGEWIDENDPEILRQQGSSLRAIDA